MGDAYTFSDVFALFVSLWCKKKMSRPIVRVQSGGLVHMKHIDFGWLIVHCLQNRVLSFEDLLSFITG